MIFATRLRLVRTFLFFTRYASSVIYYSTDARKNEIYLLNNLWYDFCNVCYYLAWYSICRNDTHVDTSRAAETKQLKIIQVYIGPPTEIEPIRPCDAGAMLRPLTYGSIHGQKSEAVENRMQQCCWGNFVQCCQQYCSALLHLIAG